jgi:hypothetical protein
MPLVAHNPDYRQQIRMLMRNLGAAHHRPSGPVPLPVKVFHMTERPDVVRTWFKFVDWCQFQLRKSSQCR